MVMVRADDWALWVDRAEVSNRAFAQFVTATGYVTDAERLAVEAWVWDAALGEAVLRSGQNWRTVNRHVGGEWSSLPVACVRAADAEQFARWVGARLPTADEMSRVRALCCERFYAARRRGTLPPRIANVADVAYGRLWPRRPGFRIPEYDDSLPTLGPRGSLDEDGCGLVDLLGNVEEICWQDSEREQAVFGGGSWDLGSVFQWDIDSWNRERKNLSDDVGFRCVRDPDS